MANRFQTRKTSRDYAPLKNGQSRKARAALYARADRHANTSRGLQAIVRTGDES